MALLSVVVSAAPAVAGESLLASPARISFVPSADEASLPSRFRLARGSFTAWQHPVSTSSQQIAISRVTFPSPMATPHANNNTVHCEYYRPRAQGKYPGVIVLHILGGDFPLARLFSRQLASHGVCALFLKMPYYGPRRQPGSGARMISADPAQTVRGMTQAVLDVRYAAAWLAARPQVDAAEIGVMGISLGGITAALAATMEPRLKNVCLLLAGGDVGQLAWDAPELAKYHRRWGFAGVDRDSLVAVLRQVDPVTYGANLRGRRILMVNARFDKVVPPANSRSLADAVGVSQIEWLDAGHFTSARFIFTMLARVTRFFSPAYRTTKPANVAGSGESG